MHDLLGLVVHLHLLLGVAVVGEDVDLRDDIECQLVSELLDCRFLTGEHLAVLLVELGHRGGSGTARSLIAGDVDPFDVADVLQRLEGDDHHYGGAVRIGYDSAWADQSIFRIALRHDKRHILIHTECARIVYHDSTMLGDRLCELLAGAASGTCECEVHALEIIIMLKQSDFNFLPAESVLPSCTAGASEKQKLIHREIPLVKHTEELLSHCATGAYYCYFHS